MSFKAYQWALAQPLKTLEKFVLVVLADKANAKTNACWPSIKTLQQVTGLGRATLFRKLNALEEQGYIQRLKHNQSAISTNRYVVAVGDKISQDDIDKHPIKRPCPSCTEATPSCDDMFPVPDEDIEPIIEPRKEPINEPIEKTESEKSKIDSKPNPSHEVMALANKLFAHWKTVMNHPRAKFDDARKYKIIKAIKLGYTEQELMQAIDGCKQSAHHQGDNEHKTVYDEFALIFRDAARIERFIAINLAPKAEDDSPGGKNWKAYFEKHCHNVEWK